MSEEGAVGIVGSSRSRALSRVLGRLAGKVPPARVYFESPEVPSAARVVVPGSATTRESTVHGFCGEDAHLREFIRSMLVWESTTGKAEAALKRFDSACVDANEMRVCLVEELVAILGPHYPLAEERAARLKASMNDLFRRENRVVLSHLSVLNKKAAVKYLKDLAGVPAFVADRVALITLGVHAVPMDAKIAARLIEAKVIAPEMPAEEASSAVTRMVKSGDALEAYLLLQGWSDEGVPLPKAKRVRTTKPAAKKKAKKKRK